jgi:glutamine synthetase adenylyltransferase
MSFQHKKAKAVPFSAADVANVANITRASPYIQRLIDDAKLRDNLRTAVDSSKSAYGRLTNGKAPAKALLEDKKLQNDLREAVEAVRDATTALTEAPKKKARKGLRLGRKLLVAVLVSAAALAGSEKLRSKVLDTLFGAEEEFQYTPPATTTAPPPASPVSAA